ncbi:hypothetical protein [Wenzhouxiangella limi]|uniref:Antitermination protein NusG n=1 Tax=Wenzhouxiangella limi TaxID=2707351 RepID=A0A845UZ25_9GAMM|nr:hypothetical protein [Wenzhouxiangella limi]NDY95150.1 hypothetical protein [Wenzhouxiangella limi]
MIKQALITLLVAVIVIVVARMKRGREQARERGDAASADEQPWYQSTTAIVGFIFAGIVILSTAGVTWLRYQHANEVVRVEVVEPSSGTRSVYQVRRKDLGEREFRTVDGRQVSLASSDRVERIE